MKKFLKIFNIIIVILNGIVFTLTTAVIILCLIEKIEISSNIIFIGIMSGVTIPVQILDYSQIKFKF